MMTHAIGLAAVSLFVGLHANAAVYSFDMTVGDVGVSGFFEINDASPNYVGGGTTNRNDLVDLAFTFTRGLDSFSGTPNLPPQTFNMTYSADLTTVVSYDFSMSFRAIPNLLQYAGNNISSNGGFIAISDQDDVFDAFFAPGLVLTAELQPPAIPLPAGLPLMAAALGALGLLGLRRRVRTERPSARDGEATFAAARG